MLCSSLEITPFGILFFYILAVYLVPDVYKTGYNLFVEDMDAPWMEGFLC
jgi:hypothetical protein